MISYKQFNLGECPKGQRPDMVLCKGTNGALGGLTLYESEEFNPVAKHSDQEGFVILDGEGDFYCDGEIIPVKKDMGLLISAGTEHCFRKKPGTKALKVFYFHAAN